MQDKEVFGMSLGNILAGICGGTPCTGVLVRTSVNVKSGATDKISQFINAIIVFLMIFIFMPAFVYTPMACIAAILITSSSRLVPISVIKQLWKEDISEFVILFLTALVCVLVDGAAGLIFGAVISLCKTAIKS